MNNEIKSKSFQSLQDIYKYLDQLGFKENYSFNSIFTKVFRDFEIYAKENGLKDDAQEAEWETMFQIYTPQNNKILDHLSFNNFNEDIYNYLVQRINSNKNTYLQALYTHLLFLSPEEEYKIYGKNAIDEYLKLIKICENKDKDKQEQEKYYAQDIIHYIKEAILLSLMIKYKKDEVKNEVIRLVNNFNFQSSGSFILRLDLIGLMLSKRKDFENSNFTNFDNVCYQVAENKIQEKNYLGAIKLLELGIKVENKIGYNQYNWNQRIAECYELEMLARENDPFVARLNCSSAIDYYKKCKNKEKIKELETQYREYSQNIEINTVDLGEDFDNAAQKCYKTVKKDSERILSTEDPFLIVQHLIAGNNIVPNYQNTLKNATENQRQFIFSSLATQFVLDSNNHIASINQPSFPNKNNTECNNYPPFPFYEYSLYVTHCTLPFLHHIFIDGIKQSVLNSQILLDILTYKTWYGAPLSKQSANGQKIEYSWVDLIAPSIENYFTQLTNCLEYPDFYKLNFVLSLDSLTLKVEGIIRDYLRLCKQTTSRNMDDGTVREKDLNNFLYEDYLGRSIQKDDLFYLKFLFVEQAGFNLRNKVAHSFLLPPDYSRLDYMNLLILALLRLAKYNPLKNK